MPIKRQGKARMTKPTTLREELKQLIEDNYGEYSDAHNNYFYEEAISLFDSTLHELLGEKEEDDEGLEIIYRQAIARRNELRDEILSKWERMMGGEV